jgi:hypothetical protein
MAEFSKEFGLDTERKIIEEGIGNFSIVSIEIKKGKKDYEQRKDDKLVKDKIDIADIDVVSDVGKQPMKYYTTSLPLVEACRDIQAKYGGSKNGRLSEPVHIVKVEKRKSEAGREYLVFT